MVGQVKVARIKGDIGPAQGIDKALMCKVKEIINMVSARLCQQADSMQVNKDDKKIPFPQWHAVKIVLY